MKVLSIGNSFSDDAQRYLRKIAAKEGVEIETLNLCIGGCPLSLHRICEESPVHRKPPLVFCI